MNYWDALAQATERLQRRDLRGAERDYLDARGLRDQSPGRVFLTETIGDAARRLWRGIGRKPESEASRWQKAEETFLVDFDRTADEVLREVRGGIDGALSEAVFLLLASRLHEPDPAAGAPLLSRLLQDALRRTTLPEAVVLPGPGVLDLEDLPAAIVAAADLLESAAGERATDEERRAWAEAGLALAEDPRLSPAESSAGDLGLGRARLLDHGLHDTAEVIEAYLDHLRIPAPVTPVRERAQERVVRLLANIGELGSPVPRYREALDALSLFEPVAPDAADRHRRMQDLVEQRRLLGRDGVWATVAADGDRRTAVLWWDGLPRDAAEWCEGEPLEPLTSFLAVAGERILSADEAGPWTPFALGPLQEVLCEPILDSEGRGAPTTFRPGPVADHPLLGDGVTVGADAALAAGTVWLGVVDRLGRGDHSWRSGLHRLARLGDGAARFIAAFLPPELVPGETWPLVPLAERPAPALPHAEDSVEPLTSGVTAIEDDRAVVASGRPDAVLAGWGGDHGRWRVVLDRPSRLRELAPTLRLRGGGFTLLPDSDRVDDPVAMLSALESLATGEGRPDQGDLLAVFHWTRLCETHNGDLADYTRLRRRRGVGSGLWDIYLDWLDDVRSRRRETPGPWSDELEARVAGSEVVVGGDDRLDGHAGVLARRWGVDADRPGSWIFCDSAVVHWRLARRDPELPRSLHDRLRPLTAGHLSLLTATSFLRLETLEHVADWLGDGPRVACRSFSDATGPLLELAGRGAVPDARVSLAPLIEGVIATVDRVAHRGGEPLVVTSSDLPMYGILGAWVRGEFADDPMRPLLSDPDSFWSRDADLGDRPLVITDLESLDHGDANLQDEGDPRSWFARDARRCDAAGLRRSLCGLEIAAWQAADPVSLTVTDPRWWREILHQPRGGHDLMLLGADDALESATGGAGVLVDLPETADQRGPVARWLTGQGWIEADGSGRPESPPPPAEPGQGGDPDASSLIVGGSDAAWFATLRRAWSRRELGAGDQGLLVVAEAPLPGMADLAAATLAPVASVVAEGRSAAWGPLTWVRPSDLEDASVRRRLAVSPPAVIWATDLRRWIPSDHGTGDEYAAAVRFLLRDVASPLRLHASRLPAVWREAWPDLVARSGRSAIPIVGDDGPQPRAGDEPAVPVIRFGRIDVPCPCCDVVTELRGGDDLCPECGLDILRWLSPARRRGLERTLLDLKLSHLAKREDGDPEAPLCLWVPSRDLDVWTGALDAVGRPWRRAVSRTLDSSRPDGTWLICLLGDQPHVPAECRHAVMAPPQDAEELAGLRRECGKHLSLWYHPLELALLDARIGHHAVPAAAEPLPRGDVLTPPEGLDPTWCWDGVLPEEVQDLVAGLPAARVRRLAGTVHWIGAVTRTEAPVEDDRGGRKLVLRLPRVEFEYRMERCLRVLPALLSMLLEGEREGVVRRLDLADLPLDVEDQDLAWCDRLLMAVAMGEGHDRAHAAAHLLYVPSRGMARSTHRDVGRIGDVEAVMQLVGERIETLAKAMLEAADHVVGDGVTIRLTPATAPGRDLLVSGVVLGAWSLQGRALMGELPTATSLGRRGSIRDAGQLARRLVSGQERDRMRWRSRLEESWRVGFLESWVVSADHPVDPHPMAARTKEGKRLADFLSEGSPGRRVLVGPRGSGRCAAVAEALIAADIAGGTAVLVPDLGWGARFHRTWRELAPDLEPPRLHVAPEARDLGRRLDSSVLPAGDEADVLVVLGLERHPAALRYQLAQRQRDGQLVAVLEPFLLEEAWEHLLLTQPESDEMIGFERLEETSRDVRDERADLLDLLGESTRLGKTRSRERGEVAAMPVTNLDNALGLLDELCSADGLESPVEVVAPLLSDLDYLGRGAARRGWLPVYRWELDALLLPGASHLLAAVCDAADDGPGRGSLLRPMLNDRLGGQYEAWLETVDPSCPLDRFAERLRRSGWAAGFASPVGTASRIEALVAAAPSETVARYAARPLVEVWRHAVGGWSGMPATTPSGPVLTLSTPDRAGGEGADTLVHLCSGIEGPRHHYGIASRARRRLVVLHQNVSPLAADAAES